MDLLSGDGFGIIIPYLGVDVEGEVYCICRDRRPRLSVKKTKNVHSGACESVKKTGDARYTSSTILRGKMVPLPPLGKAYRIIPVYPVGGDAASSPCELGTPRLKKTKPYVAGGVDVGFVKSCPSREEIFITS